MDIIKKFIEKDNFAKHLGVEVLDYSPGKAKAKRLTIKDTKKN